MLHKQGFKRGNSEIWNRYDIESRYNADLTVDAAETVCSNREFAVRDDKSAGKHYFQDF